MIGNIDEDHPLFSRMVEFIDCFLQELPFSVTQEEAIKQVCRFIKMSEYDLIILFPNRMNDILDSIIDYLNYKTTDHLNTIDSKGIKAVLKELIMYQIRLKPAMPENFRKLVIPSLCRSTMITNSKRVFSLIDTLWKLAGDQSTDYNYYSKRLILGNIYLETILFSLSDTSSHFLKTEEFLIRCFDRIKLIETVKSKLSWINNFEEKFFHQLGKFRYYEKF